MEKRFVTLSYSLILFLFLALACSKKDNSCKTCNATFIDSPSGPIEKTVCSDAEEQDFRDDNPGARITCN